jgi:hypothetical protein
VDANPHYLRTSDGDEIDLLLALGGTTIAVEVKLAAGAAPQDLARLERAADLVSARRGQEFPSGSCRAMRAMTPGFGSTSGGFRDHRPLRRRSRKVAIRFGEYAPPSASPLLALARF